MILQLCFVGEALDLRTLTCFKYTDQQGEQQRLFIVEEIAPRWKQVGTMLNFGEPDLDTIASHHDPAACSRELLRQWLQGFNDSNDSRPKTWETLLEVMRDARLGELAEKLESILTTS